MLYRKHIAAHLRGRRLFLVAAAHRPIATIAPERTLYVNSLSRPSAPALRATLPSILPLSCAVIEHWVLNRRNPARRYPHGGRADRRSSLAHSIFGPALRGSQNRVSRFVSLPRP